MSTTPDRGFIEASEGHRETWVRPHRELPLSRQQYEDLLPLLFGGEVPEDVSDSVWIRSGGDPEHIRDLARHYAEQEEAEHSAISAIYVSSIAACVPTNMRIR